MGIQSIDRAVEALELLAESGTAGVSRLADRLDVHKSTASRILSSLAAHGLVEQRDGGDYTLGLGLVRLASAVTSRPDFSQVAQVLCDRVAADTGLTANVAILDDGHAVNVSQTVGAGILAARHYIGLRTPGHATSSGKMLLAHAPEAAARLRDADLPAFTSATITSADRLTLELEEVAARGWAASNEEWEEHTTAVAVPLRLPGGDAEAALTVTGPTHSLPPESFAQTAARLTELAAATGRWH